MGRLNFEKILSLKSRSLQHCGVRKVQKVQQISVEPARQTVICDKNPA